jgi:osmotically inducible protein OsmC
MTVRSSTAVWQGNLAQGQGSMRLGSGFFEGPFTFASRFENGKGTNPEELLGAAHAGCYSMFLSAVLAKNGFTATQVNTTAKVHLGEGPKIHLIELEVEADVPGIEEKAFLEFAEFSKQNCPVSQALSAVETRLNVHLKK